MIEEGSVLHMNVDHVNLLEALKRTESRQDDPAKHEVRQPSKPEEKTSRGSCGDSPPAQCEF